MLKSLDFHSSSNWKLCKSFNPGNGMSQLNCEKTMWGGDWREEE